MAIWDFDTTVGVYERGRRSDLVFLPNDPADWSDDETTLGRVALDYGHTAAPSFKVLSDVTTWAAAEAQIGDLSQDHPGPNIPKDCRQPAADAAVLAAKLRALG